MKYDPLIALLLFIIFSIIVFLIFNPGKGWFWRLRNTLKTDEKTIMEDVLKQLYHIEVSGNEININTLSGMLKICSEDLLKVINQMRVNELVQFDGDLLKLTDEGRSYALKIVRVHRLWEKYLAEKTGYDKAEWHERAEEMEHQLSHDEAEKLSTQLGNPIYDPHGDPIPTSTGKMAELKGVPLSDLPVRTLGKIIHIEDEPDVIYRQILAEDIHIGSQIRVVENNKKKLVFYSEGEDFVLAPIVAANITVSVLEEKMAETEHIMRLSALKVSETGKIIGISRELRGESRRRLLDLGFVKNTLISIDLKSPMGNPKAYLVKGTAIALRDDQASNILIQKVAV